MTWPSVLALLALVCFASAYVLHLYRRRELAVPGRIGLAVFRLAALALLMLLLLDPEFSTSTVGREGPWVLVDGSASMGVESGGSVLWDEAMRRAGEVTGGEGTLVVFGDGVETLDPAESPSFPSYSSSQLGPALEHAAETGVRTVHLLTDLRFDDAAESRLLQERLGLEIVIEALGVGVHNAGIESFRVPAALEPAEPVSSEVMVFAAGAAGDSATLEVREDSILVDSRRIRLPEDGRLGAYQLELPAPSSEGEVRYSVRVQVENDVYPDDDERVVYADVDPEEGNLVFVSFGADWEFRFLLPVMERVVGLPARGFIRTGEDRYLEMGPEGAAGTVDRATVTRMAAGAELLVVQGSAGWIEGPLSRVRRTLVFPGSVPAASASGVTSEPPRPGEWYASAEVPPSPLAAELTGAILPGFPPLAGLMLLEEEAIGEVPLRVQLRGSGTEEPALLLTHTPSGGRRVVALVDGFWRWAFRDGAPREAYQSLWSGVAGWLLAEEALARGPGVRPESRVNTRGEPLVWTGSGLSDESIALQLLVGDSLVFDTTVVVPSTGRFRTPAAEPGTYSYVASLAGGDESWEGRLEVERWTGDLLPLPARLAEGGAAGSGGFDGRAAEGRTKPLRTTPLPYLLVLTLLSAEWIGRRRRGLR